MVSDILGLGYGVWGCGGLGFLPVSALLFSFRVFGFTISACFLLSPKGDGSTEAE